jgi:ubiquinone/menaquinone biosynthesis C-methylase UbiE
MSRFHFPWPRLNHSPSVIPRRKHQQRYQLVGGRRVAADIPYLLPKDVEDANRLDFQHFMLRAALGSLYAPPLRSPKTILDVATGTGRWAIDMAHMFPRAVVTGFDLIPPPADDAEGQAYDPGTRPANYTFVGGDFFEGLPFPSNHFDFVHQRLVYAGVPAGKWLPLIAELVRVTKPGGYVELVEGFILIDAGPATTTIQQACIELTKHRHIDITIGCTLGSMLIHAGIHDVQQRAVYIPIGRKYGRIGMLAEKDILSVFKGIGAQVVANGIMEAEDFNRLYSHMSAEFAETGTVWPVYQAFGKKPLV